MVAELGLHGLADFVHLQLERGFLELRHHAPAREIAQRAAVGAGAGIVGLGLGDLLEVPARDQLGAQVLGFGQRLVVAQILLPFPQRHGRAGHANQNMARRHGFPLGFVRVVVGLQVRRSGLGVLGDLLEEQPGYQLVGTHRELRLGIRRLVDLLAAGFLGQRLQFGQLFRELALGLGILGRGAALGRHLRNDLLEDLLELGLGDLFGADGEHHGIGRSRRQREQQRPQRQAWEQREWPEVRVWSVPKRASSPGEGRAKGGKFS